MSLRWIRGVARTYDTNFTFIALLCFSVMFVLHACAKEVDTVCSVGLGGRQGSERRSVL
jgi:hypothetical protein